MRKVLVAIGAIIISSFSLASIQAQEPQFFRIGTGGVAGTYYPIGGMIAHAISNPPGARPCSQGGSCGPPGLIMIAQSANGSVSNVRGIQQGQLESGFVQSDVAYWAYTGTGTFADREPIGELRTIASLYPESIHIVVRSDSPIRNIEDLRGKRVCLDEPGSGTLIDAELVLREYGISKRDIDPEYMKPDLAIQRIRERKLDAFFIVAGYPARAISELAQDTGLRLLPIDGPVAERLVSKYRYFSRDRIPDDVYQGVGSTATISVGAQWLVSATVDNELVYQITSALWNQNTRLLLDNGHRKGQSITLETALKGIAVPLHPGAKKYYDDIGLAAD